MSWDSTIPLSLLIGILGLFLIALGITGLFYIYVHFCYKKDKYDNLEPRPIRMLIFWLVAVSFSVFLTGFIPIYE